MKIPKENPTHAADVVYLILPHTMVLEDLEQKREPWNRTDKSATTMQRKRTTDGTWNMKTIVGNEVQVIEEMYKNEEIRDMIVRSK